MLAVMRKKRRMIKMNKIYMTNEQEKVDITPALRGLVRRAIGQALKYEIFPTDAEISVTFTDNEKIHSLNSEHRGVDRPTDVLSFPLYEAEEIDGLTEADGVCALGDIVLSLEKASEQAEEYGHSFEREVAFLCVHSVLHLLGYDHELGEEDEREMFAKQEEILKEMKLER